MQNPYDNGKEHSSSILGPTLKFKGELKAEEDLLVHGKIEGSIKHSSNLKVGKSGKIYAEVEAKYIEVHGSVKGDLKGRTAVVVKEGANISGNIFSPSVSLHEAAKFNGSIDMSEKEASKADAPKAQRQEKPAARKAEAKSDGAQRRHDAQSANDAEAKPNPDDKSNASVA